MTLWKLMVMWFPIVVIDAKPLMLISLAAGKFAKPPLARVMSEKRCIFYKTSLHINQFVMLMHQKWGKKFILVTHVVERSKHNEHSSHKRITCQTRYRRIQRNKIQPSSRNNRRKRSNRLCTTPFGLRKTFVHSTRSHSRGLSLVWP